MSFENISNETFIEAMFDALTFDYSEYDEQYFMNFIKEEMQKPKRKRDYSLIHDCYLSLSECFGYSYNNEYEKLAEKQISKNKIINDLREKIKKATTAMF